MRLVALIATVCVVSFLLLVARSSSSNGHQHGNLRRRHGQLRRKRLTSTSSSQTKKNTINKERKLSSASGAGADDVVLLLDDDTPLDYLPQLLITPPKNDDDVNDINYNNPFSRQRQQHLVKVSDYYNLENANGEFSSLVLPSSSSLSLGIPNDFFFYNYDRPPLPPTSSSTSRGNNQPTTPQRKPQKRQPRQRQRQRQKGGGQPPKEDAMISKQNVPWPHERSDIPLDPTIRIGELHNGLRYYVMPNKQPTNQIYIRMHINVGANMELTEKQHGIAHFLEHMMFQKTNSTHKNELIQTLQRMGLGFLGRSSGSGSGSGNSIHLNAETRLDETVYMLGGLSSSSSSSSSFSTTNTDTATTGRSATGTSVTTTTTSRNVTKNSVSSLSIGMAWMKDIIGGGSLLLEEEIQAEKGVIVSEMQEKDSVTARLSKELTKWLLPNSLVAKRGFVIGTEETIQSFNKTMLQEFYTKYYIPQRSTFIVVGDFFNETSITTDTMVSLIEETFGDIKNVVVNNNDDSVDDDWGYYHTTATKEEEEEKELNVAEIDYGTATEGLGLRTNAFIDEGVVGYQITMATIRPFQPQQQQSQTTLHQQPADTVQQRKWSIMTSVANSILEERLKSFTGKASVIQGGSVSYSKLLGIGYIYTVTVYPKAASVWREAAAAMEQEWRRVMEHGFTQFEINKAKAKTLNAYEQGVRSKYNRHSAELARTISEAVNSHKVVSTPEDNLFIAGLVLDTITPENLHETFYNNWNTTDINLYLATSFVNGSSVEEISEELQELFVESQQVEVGPFKERQVPVWNYTFGTPGSVVSDNFVEDFSIRQLVLSNNVRVNMKKSQNRAGVIDFRARFGTGKLGQPKKNATFLDDFTDFVFTRGALEKHTAFDIASILAGKTVGFSFDVTQGDFVMSGGASREDLRLGIQLLTAYIKESAFREEVVGLYRDGIPNLLEWFQSSLRSIYNYDLFAWLLGNDERFAAPTQEELMSFEASDARDWLEPFLNSSYLEFSIIGDFNETEVLDLILETLGALPQREETRIEISEDERGIDTPEPQSKSFTYQSKLPKAGAYVAWKIPSDVSRDIELFRQMNVLAAVFGDRMRIKIREELAGSYSPGVRAIRSGAFDYGFLIASAEGLAEQVDVFQGIILGIAANISTGTNITEDEFNRALLPIQNQLADSVQDDGYWLNVMDQSQAFPSQLDWARGRDEFYKSMNVDQINALAMEYLSPNVAYPMSILPENTTDANK